MRTVREIIDGLIREEDFPDYAVKDAWYAKAREGIHTSLSTPERIESACYHECGHLMVVVGVATQLGFDSSNFKILGPLIKFDQNAWNPFSSASMGLFVPGFENRLAQSDADVFLMAKVCMAGGESIRQFFGRKMPRGDSDDIAKFKKFSKRKGEFSDCDIARMMVKARRDFRNKVEDAEFKLRLSLMAENTKRELFPEIFPN
jgi:hypothetical protein